MGYALRDGLSFCFADGRPIFLDLNKDRYFCLAQQNEGAFQRLVGGVTLDDDDHEALGRLVGNELLVRTAAAEPPVPCSLASLPTESALEGAARAHWHPHIPRAALSLTASAAQLRVQGINAVLRSVRKRKSRPRRSDPSGHEILPQIVSAYQWSSLVTSSHDKCLWRSIAMSRHLTGLGLGHELVIGVKLGPFKAHCWVQREGAVLNDRIDNVRNFRPILVI